MAEPKRNDADLAADVEAKLVGWRGVRVAVGNAEGAATLHWRLAALLIDTARVIREL